MAIDIEAYEKALAIAREAVKKTGVESVVVESNAERSDLKMVARMQTPKVEVETMIGKRPATIEATPVGALKDQVKARAVRFALTRPDCGIQTRVAVFAKPVKFTQDGIFMERQVRKGKSGRPSQLEPFDMLSVFDSRGRKELKAMGVRFR